MENQNKIEKLAELFRQRDKIEQEIITTLGLADSFHSPATTTTSQESQPKRKYGRGKANFDKKKKDKQTVCSECGKEEIRAGGLCSACYSRKRYHALPKTSGEGKEVFRYKCLECDHTWTSFNDPNGESRDVCPKCESKLVSW